METIEIGTRNFTRVAAEEKTGKDGTHHDYCISRVDIDNNTMAGEFGHVHFQDGPIKEVGVNGCHHEDLLAIIIHRLQSYQAGKFKCRENAMVITKLEEAMHWLKHRTEARQNRSVEGTSQI